MYNGNYSSYGRSSCLQVVENHPGSRTAASALETLAAYTPKLTLASVYNQPHTIRQGIKVVEAYLYFLLQRWKNNKEKTDGWRGTKHFEKHFEK